MMKKIVVGNWKANKNIEEARHWADQFLAESDSFPAGVEVVVAPPFTLLPALAEKFVGTKVKLAVQDLSHFSAGSYTGAIATRNIMGLSVAYAILGHSERRRYFHETHQEVAGKIDQALSAGLKPLVCVDENDVEPQAAAIDDEYLRQCLVVYEPLEAIGTGRNADVGQVKQVREKIRNSFGEVPVLYGGSVEPQNIGEYTLVTDGALVGGASLNVGEFAAVIAKAVSD